MASFQNNPVRGSREQPPSISGEANVGKKRTSKSRSKVWEKVIWFTGKAKGDKDNKAGSETLATSSDLRKNNIGADVYCLCVENNGYHNKTSKKLRKVRSFNYLKRRKVRQFGDQLGSAAVVEEVNTDECDTATGTFHDFESDRRISRHERPASLHSNNISSEMPPGNNLPQLENENLKSALALRGNDLLLHGGCVDNIRKSPSFHRVRRAVSFTGPAYNSWPRTKQRNKRNDLDCPRHCFSTGPRLFSEDHLLLEMAALKSCTPDVKEKSAEPKKKRDFLSDGSFPRLGQNSLDRNNNDNSDSFEALGDCGSICISTGSDYSKDNLAKEKIMVLSCVPEIPVDDGRSLSFSDDRNLLKDIDVPDKQSKSALKYKLCDENINGSDEPGNYSEHCPESQELKAVKHPGNDDSSAILKEGSVTLKTLDIASAENNVKPGFIVIQSDAQKPFICSSRSPDVYENVDEKTDSPSSCGGSQILQGRIKTPQPRKPAINGQQFKKNTEVFC